MTDYGVVPEGFRRKTLENVLSELESDQRTNISPNINTSLAGPHGQLNATFARQAAFCWEALEGCYDSNDPDKAEADALTNVAKLTGTNRRGASKSVVTLTLNIANATVLLSGIHYAEVLGAPGNRWTPVADYTSPSTGLHDVQFKAENAGPVLANSGTITVISTPVVGWNSVTNALDATAGIPADSDPTLRARREQDLARAGSTTTRAIQADLLALVVNNTNPIATCTVIENDTDIPGYNGLAPHTVEAVILDSPPVTDSVIAQVIWDAKAGGIGTGGSVTSTAIDALSNPQTVKFSRPVSRPIYLAYTLTVGPGWIGDVQFKQAVVADLTLRHSKASGIDVYQWICELAGRQLGVLNLALRLGFSANPTGEADLSIAAREIAKFDTSRVSVVLV